MNGSGNGLTLKLEGDHAFLFKESLLAAFSEAEMREMLLRRLQRNLTDFGGATIGYEKRLFYLVTLANADGWAGDLLREVRNEKPSDPHLIALSARLQATPRLEAAVDSISKYYDPGISARIMRWVCRVSCGGVHGSGILIGPDLVLTNYHVIEEMQKPTGKLDEAVCVFDHRLLATGTQDPGRSVALDQTWNIPTRPYNMAEALPTQPAPLDTELDYAILRLAEPVGNQPVGDVNKAALGAEPRGWLDVTVNFAKHKITVNSPVNIFQYPKFPGMEPLPLQASQGTLVMSPWPSRIRYNSITDGGSSGSPCFNNAMELIALHHAVDGSQPPTFNQGVPLKAMLSDWKQREAAFLAQGVTPPWKVVATPAIQVVPVQLLRDDSPHEALVLGTAPKLLFLGRNKLRGNLAELTTPGNSYRLVSMTGPKDSGKSYSWHLIQYVARTRGITPVLLDIAGGLELAEACEAITDQMGFDVEEMRTSVLADQPTPDRVGRKFASWLARKTTARKLDKWWLVFDGLDEADGPSPELRDNLVQWLTKTMVRDPNFTQVVLILLGSGTVPDERLLPYMLTEQIEPLQSDAIGTFITGYAQSIGKTLRPEERRALVENAMGNQREPLTPPKLREIFPRLLNIIEGVLT